MTSTQSNVTRINQANRLKKRKSTWLAYGMLLPSMIILVVFTLYPIGESIYMSLFKNNMSTFVTGPVWVGLQNYVTLFTRDAVFKKAFYNNLIIAAVTIALAVAMALFANKVRRGKGIVRVSYFYPTLLPMVAVANIWLFVYTPMYGLLGYLAPTWRLLENVDTVLWALIVMLVWKQAGYVMIFYISGLQGIDQEMYEAAKIDGANAVQAFSAHYLAHAAPHHHLCHHHHHDQRLQAGGSSLYHDQGRPGQRVQHAAFLCVSKGFRPVQHRGGFRHHRGADCHFAAGDHGAVLHPGQTHLLRVREGWI